MGLLAKGLAHEWRAMRKAAGEPFASGARSYNTLVRGLAPIRLDQIHVGVSLLTKGLAHEKMC